jgi:hypothetical protein
MQKSFCFGRLLIAARRQSASPPEVTASHQQLMSGDLRGEDAAAKSNLFLSAMKHGLKPFIDD